MTTSTPKYFSDLFQVLDIRLPHFRFIDGSDMPEPFRHLLVHHGDMTRRLENFHGRPIHLHTLGVVRQPEVLFRQVLLKTNAETIVEFGAIQINLNHFTGEPLKRISDCYQPLGGILNEFGISYQSKLEGFFEIESDAHIQTVLGLDRPHRLFGRQNRLAGESDETLARVVEILPPIYDSD